MEWNESVVFAFVFCSLLFLLLFTVDLCCVRSLPFITSGNKWAREWKEMEHNTPPFHSLFPLVYNGSEKEAWNKEHERNQLFTFIIFLPFSLSRLILASLILPSIEIKRERNEHLFHRFISVLGITTKLNRIHHSFHVLLIIISKEKM